MADQKLDVKKLIEELQSKDMNERTEAWLGAGKYGARALGPLARLAVQMAAQTGRLQKQEAAKEEVGYALEVHRAAKRAMWKIVRTAGDPASRPRKRNATVKSLVDLLGDDRPSSLRREALWMISEIGESDAVTQPVAALLQNKALREDACMVLERLPGDEPVAALKAAFEKAPEDFKTNLAQSLRKRGVPVEGYPCQKLVPTRQTQVKPVSA